MDKKSHVQRGVEWINYPYPNLYGAAVQIWEYQSNFTPLYIMDEITYPFWD